MQTGAKTPRNAEKRKTVDTVNPVGIIIIFALIALFYLACMAVGKR